MAMLASHLPSNADPAENRASVNVEMEPAASVNRSLNKETSSLSICLPGAAGEHNESGPGRAMPRARIFRLHQRSESLLEGSETK